VKLPGGSGTLPVSLDYNWVGTKLYTTILNLEDQRNWIINGTFRTGTNKTSPPKSPPWAFYTFSGIPSDPDAYVDTGNYVSRGQYVNVSMPWLPLHDIGKAPGSRQYSYDEYVAWNETFTVPRGGITAANLSMAFHPNFAPMLADDDWQVFVQVNSHFVFETGFATISTRNEQNKWDPASFSAMTDVNGSSVFNSPAQQTMTISIGVIYVGPSGWYWDGLEDSQNGCYFANVSLALTAYAKPEQLNLKVAAPSPSNKNVSITSPSPSSYGAGSGTLTGFQIGPAGVSQPPYYFSFTSNVSSPASGSFIANATIYASRQKTATATFVQQGSLVNWSISLVTWPQSSSWSIGTTTYTKYYYNVSLPSDWTLTKCIDPNLGAHTINTGPIFSNWTEGSIRILRVNVTYVGYYSNPSNNFNPYVIYATSSNYVNQVWTQIQLSGSTYANSTKFYPQNWTRFVAYIVGPKGAVSGGIANLTISGPPTYGASPVVLNFLTGVKPSNGYAYFLVYWNSTDAAGSYTGEVDWSNNTIDEAGSLTCAFTIYHKFMMSITVPGQGTAILKGQYLISPPTTVSIVDYYTGAFMTATVVGRAEWESAGRWDTFTTYSASNASYSNQTDVPSSLIVGNQYWLAVNATLQYYDKATANNSFWIGSASSISPTLQTISIYYTESNSFNVSLSNIYYYEGTGPAITNATITLVAGSSTNNSLIQWSTRFSANTKGASSGYYSGWLYVGTLGQSTKAIPPSSTQYTILFQLSQGKYYQTQYFTLYLKVAAAPCSLSIYSVSGQSVFWGSIETVKLDLTTSWTFGSLSLPTTPILNYTGAPSYAPPYVRVNCGGWAGNWTVTHLTLDPSGIYTLYINTATFGTPTNDGSGAGTVTFNIQLCKANYYNSSANIVTVTLHIMRLSTRVTGAVQQSGGVITLTNTTGTYPGDTENILVWYNDTHLSNGAWTGSTGVAGATVTCTSSIFNGSLAVTSTGGLYNLTLSGTITYQRPGSYFLTVLASDSPDYVAQTVVITLKVSPLPCTLTPTSTPASFYYDNQITYLLWFNDTHNNVPIALANFTISVPSGINYYGITQVTGSLGLWNLTLVLPVGVGSYEVSVTATNVYYAGSTANLQVNVVNLPTVLGFYTVSGGVEYIEANASVRQSSPVTIYLWFNNTYNNVGIGGVASSITYKSTEWGNGFVSAVAGTPGLYNVTFLASKTGAFNVTFTASYTGYAVQVQTFTVDVYTWSTSLGSYVVSGGVPHVQSNFTVSLGGYVTIYLWFNNTYRGANAGIGGVATSITYTSTYSGWKPGWVSPVAGHPGLYNATFQATSAGSFAITFVANVTGYQVQTLAFTVNVPAPPPGFSIVTLAIVGVGGGGIVLLAAAAMIFVRRARMPFVIKKINETLGLISKGQHEQATAVPLKSRDEIVTGIMAERVESFTKRKPSKEEEAVGQVATTPVAAPTAETSAALKEELKAVGEEKPEEGIEEVEMNTLDEQLQQLEKVESKENLPDGAKEVRDVIEKYKEGKKRKKET
jgi:hypothetical protein